MPPRYGSLSILDTLATYNNTTVLAFGEEELAGFLEMFIAAYENWIAQIQGEFAGTVPMREWAYGVTNEQMEMVDLDEFGLPDAQKVPFTPSSVGFPLRRVGAALQWTRDWLATHTPAEMALQVRSMVEADERRWYRDLRRALLGATNNTAYIDRFVDNRNFTIRALVNGDGQAIPPQPTTLAIFNPATHNHYLATASFIEANLIALIETVREHGVPEGAGLRVYINQAQEATVRGFAGFEPYTDARLIYDVTQTRAAQTTDQVNLEERAIGFHGPAEVWVRPWVPASYVICHLVGAGGEPVLGIRVPEGPLAPFANLRIVARLDRHPLHAESYERMRGVAVWNRIRAAVLYTGGGAYVSYTGS